MLFCGLRVSARATSVPERPPQPSVRQSKNLKVLDEDEIAGVATTEARVLEAVDTFMSDGRDIDDGDDKIGDDACADEGADKSADQTADAGCETSDGTGAMGAFGLIVNFNLFETCESSESSHGSPWNA